MAICSWLTPGAASLFILLVLFATPAALDCLPAVILLPILFSIVIPPSLLTWHLLSAPRFHPMQPPLLRPSFFVEDSDDLPLCHEPEAPKPHGASSEAVGVSTCDSAEV